MTDIEKIDLTRFLQVGEGANGLSYNSLDDPQVMVKMYNKGYDTSTIFTELDVARKVYELGIPTPRPGQLVTDGERIGIIFRRIDGKRSFARAISEEPDRYDEYTREFALLCKKLHTFECPQGMFPDARQDFMRMLKSSGTFSDKEKSKIEHFLLKGLPECHTALHGDMHVGNVLTTLPKGASFDTPHQVYYIDLGYFSYGCPLIDIGMMSMIGNYSDDVFLIPNMHYDVAMAKKVWESFADEYFFGPEKLGEKWFGPTVSHDNILGLIDPYVLLKLLLVEYNVGFMPESYLEYSHNVVSSL